MTTAFMFPGQGSQAVGMGKSLAESFASARAVFAEVDDALGQNLSQLMWEGPEAELTLTENAQPALMAVSMAVVRVLEAEHGIAPAGFQLRALRRDSAGRWLAIGPVSRVYFDAGAPASAVRFLPDGQADPSYGRGGVAFVHVAPKANAVIVLQSALRVLGVVQRRAL